MSFSNYEDLEAAFAKQDIHPGDLKTAVEIYINRLLDPIRKEFEADPKLKSLANKAYPPAKKQSNLACYVYLIKKLFLSRKICTKLISYVVLLQNYMYHLI